MTNIFRKNESYTGDVSMTQLSNEIYPVMATDESFQASDEGRWELKDQIDYILSTMLGWAPSKFVLADVDACLKSAEERGAIEDAEYFRYWQEKGVKYLNIDSHNRNKCIEAFMNNEVPLAEGVYEIPGYTNYPVKGQVTWNDFRMDLKDYFLTVVKTSVEIYTNASREDLSNLASCVNKGKAWNRPEFRNTTISKVASKYRDLAKTYMPYFKGKSPSGPHFLSAEELKRRGLDDFMATMGSYTEYGFSETISHGKKDAMYKSESSHEKFVNRASIALDNFFKLLQKNKGENLYALKSKIFLFDLWGMFWDISTKNMKINDAEKMIVDYINVIAALLKDKEEYVINDDKKLTFAGMKKLSPVLNSLRRELITSKFNMEDYAVQLGNRSQNADEKLISAYEQAWVTPEGKPIDPSRLQTGDYHNGHVIPHIDGGTEFVIQTAEDNLKLGANPVV